MMLKQLVHPSTIRDPGLDFSVGSIRCVDSEHAQSIIVHGFKWSSTDGRVCTSVVPEFRGRQPMTPLTGTCVNKATEVCFQTPIEHLNNSVQKWLVKILSRSEIRAPCKPCKRYTVWKKDLATDAAVNGWQSGMKCPYLVRRSTTTSKQL
jgi:hypothetical protein